jgi:hypothetical protein
MIKKIIIPTLFLSSLLACNDNQQTDDFTGITVMPECKINPLFVKMSGFNPQSCAMSTIEKQNNRTSTLGIVLQEITTDGSLGRIWQHPSWKSVGHLSPIVINEKGDVFAGPVPLINILENKPDSQNFLYKINSETALLNEFIKLPAAKKSDGLNPFGILGLGYDCETKLMYVTSVMGSTHNDEVGRIFCVSTNDENPTVVDMLENIDAIGVGISILNDKKRLFFGGARTSEIFSIELDENGKFKGKAKFEFSIAGVGPWGDEKARKIRFDKNGNMVINCTSFEYNLKPGVNGPSTFIFHYNILNGKWEQINKDPLLSVE